MSDTLGKVSNQFQVILLVKYITLQCFTDIVSPILIYMSDKQWNHSLTSIFALFGDTIPHAKYFDTLVL
jgi:hypothetical protein